MLIPIPNLREARRLLCVQPHYDDNDIGAGGTIASLRQSGAEVLYLTVTDDLLGVRDPDLPDPQARERLRGEQLEAARALGGVEQAWLELPDAGDYDYFELRRAVIRQVRAFRPDFVLTCDPWLPYEAHRDHTRVGRAVAEAAILHRFVRLRTDPEVDRDYEPYTLGGVGFYFTGKPNTFFDIDAARAFKHRALDAYRSQFSEPELALLHAALDIKERGWASGQSCTHAEALRVMSPSHLHVNPDADEMFG